MTTAAVATLVLVGGCQSGGDGGTASPDVTRTPTTPATAPPPSPSPPAATVTPPPSTTPSSSAPPTGPASPTPSENGLDSLRRGDSGPAVRALQQRLDQLGYWLGEPDGAFGPLTEQAVYAVQKAAGLRPDGVVGPKTRSALAAGTRPSARSSEGQLAEVDLDRQLLLLVDDGAVTRTFNTSTGTFEKYTHDGETYLADTPRGRWRIGWQVDGWRDGPLGRLYRPKYFHHQGIAIHGYPSVPPWPASHGCVRVTLAAMDWLWQQDELPLETAVWVY